MAEPRGKTVTQIVTEDLVAAHNEPRRPKAYLVLDLPLRTKSLTNQHEHWRHRARRAKAERLLTRTVWRVAGGAPLASGATALVTLTRVSPRELDSDNLPPSMKSVRDELAACLGLDDRDRRIVWAYDQRKPAKGETRYAVLVEVLVESAAQGGTAA